MVLSVAGGIVGLTAAWLLGRSITRWAGGREALDYCMWVFVVVMGSVLGVMAGVGAATLIGRAVPVAINDKPSHVGHLVSLRSADGVTGRITGGLFLTVGVIGTQQYYFYYEQDGTAVVPRQHRAGVGTYVYEQDRTDAVVHVFDWHFRQPWWEWVAFNDSGQTWRFYVPTGTVAKGFALQ